MVELKAQWLSTVTVHSHIVTTHSQIKLSYTPFIVARVNARQELATSHPSQRSHGHSAVRRRGRCACQHAAVPPFGALPEGFLGTNQID